MEEITRLNFKKKFPEIEKNIKSANFISIDSEFSGLVLDSKWKNSLFDLGKDRYDKLRNNIEKFIALQVGITTFHFNRERNEYLGKIYNFHIFPRSFATVDTRFLCQASSWAFLSQYNFDFNKCVRDGLPFLNVDQERQLKVDLKSKFFFSSEDNRAISIDHEKLLQKELSGVGNWLRNNESEVFSLSYGLLENNEALIYYFQKEVRQHFPNVWTKALVQDIEVRKVTPEERERLEAEADELDDWILETIRGFTNVFRLLVESKKPIVGHNLILDLMILYNQFQEPLPVSYETFKQKITRLFPNIYDTKYISYQFKKVMEKNGLQSEVWTSNILKNLYDYFQKPSELMVHAPEVTLNTDQSKVDEKLKESFHMAGWDSYVTGFCFAKLGYYFAALKYGRDGIKRPLSSTEHVQGVSDYNCKLNVIRASIAYFNLAGKDPPTNRPQALIIKHRKNKRINLAEILELLSKYAPYDTMPLRPDSIIVAVPSYSMSRSILREFYENETYKVLRYHVWKEHRVMKAIIWSSFIISTGVCVASFVHWIIKNKF